MPNLLLLQFFQNPQSGNGLPGCPFKLQFYNLGRLDQDRLGPRPTGTGRVPLGQFFDFFWTESKRMMKSILESKGSSRRNRRIHEVPRSTKINMSTSKYILFAIVTVQSISQHPCDLCHHHEFRHCSPWVPRGRGPLGPRSLLIHCTDSWRAATRSCVALTINSSSLCAAQTLATIINSCGNSVIVSITLLEKSL